MRYSKIYEGVFDVQLHFVWGCDEIEARDKFLKVTGLPSIPDDLGMEPNQFGDGSYVFFGVLGESEKQPKMFNMLWLRSMDNSARDISIAAHEVLHIVDSVCEMHGIPLTEDTQEVRAYYTEFWLREILMAVQKPERKKKK